MKTVTVLIAVFLMACMPLNIFAQGKVSLLNSSDYTIKCNSGIFNGEFLTPGDQSAATYIASSKFVMSIFYGKGTLSNKDEGTITLTLDVPTNSSTIALTNDMIKKLPTKAIVNTSVMTIQSQPKNFVVSANYTQKVWVINATSYRMEGKTGPIEGMLLEPTSGGPDSVTGFYPVGPNLFYDPLRNEFYDGNTSPITEAEVLNLTKSGMCNIAQLLVQLGPIEENLKYYKGDVSEIALASVLERIVTKNTRSIVITDDDLDKYRLKDRKRSRKLVNKSAKKFHFVMGEKKEICPARKSSKRPGFISMGYLESGIYYLEATFIKNGRIVTRDILMILGKTDKYVIVTDKNLDAADWTGQETLN